ncbi:N-acetylmuramoyl-L-alanine amidase LytC precursor [Streptococcus parauberis]|nr:N-acetylmuramoyl-L-alanine amidase LytC precursor [Streptococcus parauberis]KYP18445.1 N-acetylmuramoyl-L-alanine amidase LytC precursor [Streptococcus parauberis]KYP20654.1 N-acetylmuramoyl-L-alanine amidase LytC precursor [Streptococcus parauberis]KYP24506.1 N-acetylmuramoyl-L-alanine amidase LytC precursor [Streptococcus parauberis]KYP26885.1 N-acetylmuramoyl-L-alanine amidase LytC precursor [Streptococcus parauberis]
MKLKNNIFLIAPFVLSMLFVQKNVLAEDVLVEPNTPSTTTTTNINNTTPVSTDSGLTQETNSIVGTGTSVPNQEISSSDVSVTAEVPVSELNLSQTTSTTITSQSVVLSSTEANVQTNESTDIASTVTADEVNQVASLSEEISAPEKQMASVTMAATTTSPVTATADDKGISITYNQPIPTDASILYAVWGDVNNQNDLVWYTASAQGAAYVDFSRHKEFGSYHIHAYQKSDGVMKGITTLEVTLLKPQVTSQITQTSPSSFTINVNNVPDTITSVSIPVWTDQNGQDDLKWYKASKVATGNYQVLVNIANHNNEKGLYKIHIYGQSTITGGQIGLLTTTFSNVETKPNATVSVTNYQETKTSFTVNVVGTSQTKTISSISMAVWSESAGQDDLKWYKPQISNNSTSQLIDIANHSNTSDNYIVHVYTNYTDGSKVGTNLGSFKISKEVIQPVIIQPKVTVSNYQADKGILTVDVQGGTKTIKKVSVAAWSLSDQSNIHWYQTTDLLNQTASIQVNEALHQFLAGNYTVHTYIDFSDNTRSGFNLGQYYFESTGKSASQGNYAIINKVVYLDAGHGGYDPGASYFNQTEKTLNLAMQNLVKTKLEAAGYKVVLTRTDDSYMDLLPRSEKANNSLSDLFVSMHFNASTASTANGIETYYYEYYPEYPSKINETFHNDAERLTRSSMLANAIQAATVSNTGAKNNGVLRNTFAVLRETTAPAVLLELGYMSNPTEFQRINSSAYQEKLAQGIVSGILSYYKTYTI